MNEFELIARYFARPTRERQGVGDDCALIDVGDCTLALTSDLLAENRHFFAGTDPASLGHKSLAVNLSDLAAAGARPRCFLLSLALPRADEAWLEAFSASMLDLAHRAGCDLVGGDTTRSPPAGDGDGPIVVSITAIGEVDRASIRGRSGARAGDDLWVSGQLGDAAAAVAHRRGRLPLPPGDAASTARRLDWPEARVALGLALRGIASAAIDVSDGLAADLGHLLQRSGTGARVVVADVPRSEAVGRLDGRQQQRFVLAGGDDYELLFTAPPARRAAVEAAGRAASVPVTIIGSMTYGDHCEWIGAQDFDATLPGYDHFSEAADP